jgi:hypothetical protein
MAMVCHVPSAQKLVNAIHTHYELPLYDFGIKTGATQGYEIYVFDSGIFVGEGDGGLNNWCFAGHYTREKGKFENHVTFLPIQGPLILTFLPSSRSSYAEILAIFRESSANAPAEASPATEQDASESHPVSS